MAAIRTLRQAVDGILDGAIAYSDIAGGVSQGVLLWNMGITAEDKASRTYALKYLKRLAKRKRSAYWPGPLARFAVAQNVPARKNVLATKAPPPKPTLLPNSLASALRSMRFSAKQIKNRFPQSISRHIERPFLDLIRKSWMNTHRTENGRV